jgi:hypothetical protein
VARVLSSDFFSGFSFSYQFHIQVTHGSSARTGNVPQSSCYQHQGGVAIWKCANNAGSASDFPQNAL